MALQRIKISEFPQAGALADTDFLAIGLPDGTGAKISIAAARAFIGVSVVAGIAETSTDPGTPTTGETYFAGIGTFTNFLDSGGQPITTTENLNAFTYNGTFWDVLPIPIGVDLSGYATKAEFENVNDSINEVQADMNQFAQPGKNLINRQLIEAGNYATNGNKAPSNNWIRTPHLPVLPATAYTLSGYGAIASNARVCYYDESHTFISFVAAAGGTTPITFTTPAGTAFLGITIANVVDIGLDPTNNQFALTVQLELGSTATSYQEYGIVLESAKLDNIGYIDGLGARIDEITVQSKNLIDKSLLLSGNYSPVNGNPQASNNWIRTPHIAITQSTQYTLSGYGGANPPSARFCFYNSSGTFISTIVAEGATITTPVTITSPAGAAFVGMNVANVVNIGLDPTNNQFANSVMLEVGDTATGYQPYGVLVDSSKLSGTTDTYDPNYYEYNPAGGEGNGAFKVYSRVGQTDHYIGFEIRHQINAAETIFLDYWRLYDAWMYKFQDGAMLVTPHRALTSGENECVYRVPNSLDFTGGFHGNEKTISGKIWFYADGVAINISGAIELTSCNEFQYREQSNMYEPPTSGGVVNPAHPVHAIHDKITTIKEAEYKTFNRLTWQASLTISIYYHGISCIGKAFASIVMNEYLTQATMVGGDANFLEVVGAREYYSNNLTNLISAQATSKLITPAALDTLCKMFVWDRAADSKYYRQLPANETVTSGNVYESEMSVKFNSMQ